MRADVAVLGLDGLPAATLVDVDARAALMRRVDRKYLVPVDAAARLVRTLVDTHAVLEIDGRRSTTYRSTYFDTDDLRSVRSHVQRRRRRWKVRHRWYAEDDLCRLEVKTKDGRGLTVKSAAVSTVDRYGTFGAPEAAFVSSVLGADDRHFDVDALRPTAEVTYRRGTLVDLAGGTRLTIDWDLRTSLLSGSARLDGSVVLVETKGGPLPASADHILRALGIRERSFSKYVAGATLVSPDLHDNDVRHLRGTVLHIDRPAVALPQPEGSSCVQPPLV